MAEDGSSNPTLIVTPDHRASASRLSPDGPEEDSSDKKISRLTKSFSNTTRAIKQLFVKDDEHFHNLFPHVPSTETLVEDYSCALLRDILVHGRLYISQNYFCFHANIFGWETMLTLPCKDIQLITKEKTLLRIPTLQIGTATDKHTFQSFLSRDSAYKLLFKVWQNSLLKNPLNPQQLMQSPQMGRRRAHSSHSNHSNHSNEPPSPVDKEQRETPSPRPATPVTPTAPSTATSNATASRRTSKQQGSNVPMQGSARQGSGSVTCGCDHSLHAGRRMLGRKFEMSVDQLFDSIFNNQEALEEFYIGTINAKNLDVEAWEPLTGAPRRRGYTMTIPLVGYSFGPKTAGLVVKEHVVVGEPSVRYVVDSEVCTPKVPYGSVFYNAHRYCMTRAGENSSYMTVFCEIRYRKGEPWALTKSLIEKNGYAGVQSHLQKLSQYLEDRAETLQSGQASSGFDAPAPGSLLGSIRKAARSVRSDDQMSFDSVDMQPIEPGGLLSVDFPEMTSKLVLQVLVGVLLFVNLYFFYRIQCLEAEVARKPTLRHSPLQLPDDGDAAGWRTLYLEQQGVLKELAQLGQTAAESLLKLTSAIADPN